MDFDRSSFQHHQIHRSRSPSCCNYFNRDPRNYQLKFLRLRHARHHQEKLRSTHRQAFNFTPVSLESTPLYNHNHSFSYDEQLLSKDVSKLTGVSSDLELSADKLDLDDIIGRLTSGCSLDPNHHHDFSAHHPSPNSDDRVHHRSLSVPASSGHEEGRVWLETPLDAGRVTTGSIQHERLKEQSNQRHHQLQANQRNTINQKGTSKNREWDLINVDDIDGSTLQDGYETTVQTRENILTPDKQDLMDSVCKEAVGTSKHDGTKQEQEKLPQDDASVQDGPPAVSEEHVDLPLEGTSSLPLHPSISVIAQPPSDASPTLSPVQFGHRSQLHAQVVSDSSRNLINSPSGSRHHPLKASFGQPMGNLTLPAHTTTVFMSPSNPPSPANRVDLPPQTYAGKANPLLPPPLPAPKPRYQISFPRPFRRRLSILQPSSVPLPPSPPPEFDFTTFENSLDLSACNLIDDSPCMPISAKPFDESDPLIDLTVDDAMHPTNLAPNRTDFSTKDVPLKTPLSRFTPSPSPINSENVLLGSLISSPSSTDWSLEGLEETEERSYLVFADQGLGLNELEGGKERGYLEMINKQ